MERLGQQLWRCVPLATVMAAALAAGCGHPQASAPPRDPENYSPLRDAKVSLLKPSPTLLASGHLPLAYIFDTGGSLRIMDATDKTLVLRATAAPGAIISVAPGGILVGSQRLHRGPLPPDHQYEIWWDTK